jgi:septal ring factor EnvC (AmiA/AmiB activator)
MRAAAVLLAALVVLGLPPGAPAETTDPAQAARRAAQDIRAAARALQEAGGARDRVAALTRTVRAYEDGLAALREGLRRAAVRDRALGLELDSREAELARLLGSLQAMERAPSPLLLVHPSGPVGTARAGMMLSEVLPAMAAEAAALGAELEELRVLAALQEAARDDLSAGLSGLQQARSALSLAVAERRDLPRRLAADPAELAILAASAETLEGFAASLPEPGPPPPGAAAPGGFAQARGALRLPVSGSVLRRFGEADAAGIRRPGLVLAAPPLALVTAPWPATVRYAGPLLDYANVIVLEPGDGYLMVLAGLGAVYAEAGQILDAGAPLGLLGGSAPGGGEFLAEQAKAGGTARQETLYIELRQDGEATDPAAWFALDTE